MAFPVCKESGKMNIFSQTCFPIHGSGEGGGSGYLVSTWQCLLCKNCKTLLNHPRVPLQSKLMQALPRPLPSRVCSAFPSAGIAKVFPQSQQSCQGASLDVSSRGVEWHPDGKEGCSGIRLQSHLWPSHITCGGYHITDERCSRQPWLGQLYLERGVILRSWKPTTYTVPHRACQKPG